MYYPVNCDHAHQYSAIPGYPKFAFPSHMAHDTIKFMAERKTKTKIRSAQLFVYYCWVDCVAPCRESTARGAALNALRPNY